jgi:uncharacterized protein YqeY
MADVSPEKIYQVLATLTREREQENSIFHKNKRRQYLDDNRR